MARRIDKFLDALKKEKEEEEAQLLELLAGNSSAKQLQRSGKALANQIVQAVRTGLFERMVVTCAPAHGGALPATEISHGKPVVITMPDSRYRGFVFSTSEATIDVCVDVGENGEKIALGDRLDIMPAPDDITYRRMKAASEEMKKMIETRSSRTVDIIFGESQPYPQVSTESFLAPKTDVKNLNKEQLEAVRASLAIQDLMCLHGPPGTGKSTTVAAIVAEAAQRGIKTIVTCPSNAAVDALVEKLAKRREVVVTRLGHPARTSPHLRQYTLEAKMADVEMLRGLKSDMYAASGRERGELRKEHRDREKKCSTEILANSHAVVATCTVVGMKSILDVISDPEHFGLAIVDEAGQAVEPAIYPILRRCSKKLILAGDPAQLPPTVKSKGASILTKTLLEDLMGRFPSNTVLLKRQYRMNKMISDWVSDSMYRGELIADESVQNHTLADLLQDVEGVAKQAGADFVEDILSSPMTLIDTVGSNMDEDQVSEDQSKSNPGEALLATLTTKILIKAGIKPKNIAIISPYAAQVQLIAKLVGPTVSVRTVDGYQGGEAEVVILSLVRSNIDGTTGFLSDRRRLNVAVSRARKSCIVIGDSGTVTRDSFIEKMFEYFGENANLISPAQFQACEEYESISELAGYSATNKLPLHSHTTKIASQAPDEPKRPKKPAQPKNDPKPKNINSSKSKLEKRLEKQVQEAQAKPTVNEIIANNIKQSSQILSKPFTELKIEEPEQGKCPDCNKNMPVSNLELHQIHCARLRRERPKPLENDKTKKDQMKKQKKIHQRISKNTKDPTLEKEYDDDDALLDAAISSAGNCAFGTCKVSVRVMPFVCSSCGKHFCGTHKFAESHGCKSIPMNQRKGSSTSYNLKQKQLKNKLDSKLKDMEKGRKTTNKTKKK